MDDGIGAPSHTHLRKKVSRAERLISMGGYAHMVGARTLGTRRGGGNQMSFEGMGAVLDSAADACGFRVWAPNASNVHVTGPFCDWRDDEHPLAKEGSGYGATTRPNIAAGEHYRFVIQNGSQHWRVDAYARDVAQDGDGNLCSASARWLSGRAP